MAIGERIKFFRNMKKLTQKSLGVSAGLQASSADIRIAQYESGLRSPKSDLTNSLAQVLEISPEALNVSNIDKQISLVHTFFAMEDIHGLTIDEKDGELCLSFPENKKIKNMLAQWNFMHEKLKDGKISKEDYDKWRYNYPLINEKEIEEVEITEEIIEEENTQELVVDEEITKRSGQVVFFFD